MPGKRGARPMRAQTEAKDPKGYVNGFKKDPRFEDGEFLESCFSALRSAKGEVVYVDVPSEISEEERMYVIDRLSAVHWRVTVRANRMRIIDAPRHRGSAKPLDLPKAASDYE